MTKIQSIKYTLFYIILILIGYFIAFKVFWSEGGARYLGIISFFIIGFGSLFVSISLTRLLVPVKTDFNYSTLADKQNYKVFEAKIGKTMSKVISISLVSLFIIFFGGSAYLFVGYIKNYEKNQFENYGQLQKVKIREVDFKGKGSPYAFFDFYLKGKKYSRDLGARNYVKGDSAYIIFSTENPDIVKWADQ